VKKNPYDGIYDSIARAILAEDRRKRANTIDTSNKDLLLAKSQLLARGWTAGLIAKYLGEPDELRTNPHYKSGPKMRLYAWSRVEPLERKKWFLEAKAKRAARSASAKRAVETKENKLLNWIDNLDVQIPRRPVNELVGRAIAHYNDREGERFGDSGRWADLDSDSEFLVRITENYLRHGLTDYESQLSRIFGQVGTEQAYYRLRARIQSAISDAYPRLGKVIEALNAKAELPSEPQTVA
jgi:hypothetical protein